MIILFAIALLNFRIHPRSDLLKEENLLLQQKKFAQAAEVYAELRRDHKDDPELAMRQGAALELAGNFDQALAVYEEAARTKTNVAAGNNAAYLISELYPKDAPRLQEALAMAEQAAKAQPTIASFHDTKGWLAYLLGQYPIALEELRRAVSGLPDSAEAHYHLGLAEGQGGSEAMARLHLEASVALSIGLPAERAAALAPAERRAGQRAQEALKALPATQAASMPASAP